MNGFRDGQLVPLSPQSINLKSSDRILCTPNDKPNFFTLRCSTYAIGDWKRGICRIVCSEIYAVAATAALRNRVEVPNALDRVGSNRACRRALQGGSNDGELFGADRPIDLESRRDRRWHET
jgi:hypothetical protein